MRSDTKKPQDWSYLESPAEGYQYLVRREHPSRRQLYIKGRNLTVGQLVATMRANKLSPEDAADDYELPIEQIREALAYYEANHDLVDAELREEKRWLVAQGVQVEPKALS
jgi:uncharacterized protein (DUF433 family)